MFSSAKRKETFGCSSSHHPTCLLPSQPVHPLYTKSMHTRPYKHTATTRNFEVIAFSPNVESCTVNWKKTTFITTGLASMGWGGELLPSTGNNLDISKRPGIKGPFFFFFFSPHQEKEFISHMGPGEVERISAYVMCIKNYGIVQISMLSFLRALDLPIRSLEKTEMSLLSSSTTPSSSSVAAESPCACDTGSPHMKPPQLGSYPPPENVWRAFPAYLLASQLSTTNKNMIVSTIHALEKKKKLDSSKYNQDN